MNASFVALNTHGEETFISNEIDPVVVNTNQRYIAYISISQTRKTVTSDSSKF